MLKDILKEYYDSVLNETDLYQKSKTLVNFLFKDINAQSCILFYHNFL